MTVKQIVATTERNDQQARASGELLKYIVELFDDKGVLNEVREIYSKHYLFEGEIVHNLKIHSRKYYIRGPFPLVEGALTDSRLNRWEKEKEKASKDEQLLTDHFFDAKEKDYKYGYIVYEETFGVKTFVELKFTHKALPQHEVSKILRNSPRGKQRHITRVKLSDGKEKIYQ